VEVSVDMSDMSDVTQWPQITQVLDAIGDKIDSTFQHI
jgi:hypothetical protein